MLDIAIQIVNYNTKKYLIDCIVGIMNDLRGTMISYEIFVLDNNSEDDLSDLEKKYKGMVNFYKSEKNLGFGAGHNFLAKQADSKYLLILNPDLKFSEVLTIKRLYDFLEKGRADKIVVVGPKLFTVGGVQRWDHGEINGFWAWFANKVGGSHWQDRDNIIEVAWVSGAFFLAIKSIFDEVDGFDERFFLYKEEEDLQLRIRKRGFKIFYNPKTKVFHYSSVVASKSEFFDVSDKYFFEKHFRDKGLIFFILNRFKHRIVNKFLY